MPKKLVDKMCAYCGAGKDAKERLINGNLRLRVLPGAEDDIECVKNIGAEYWLRVCPACGALVGVSS